MAGIPLVKKDKNGNIVIFLQKDIYRFSIIRDIVKSVDDVRIKPGLKGYFCMELGTKDFKKGLEFCNYLFSEHG